MTTQALAPPRDQTLEAVNWAGTYAFTEWSHGFTERQFDPDEKDIDPEQAQGKCDELTFEEAVARACLEMGTEKLQLLAEWAGFSPPPEKLENQDYRLGLAGLITEPLQHWLEKNRNREYVAAEAANGRQRTHLKAVNLGNHYTGAE